MYFCTLETLLRKAGDMEEYSCPNCRSNLYDPLSGCSSCRRGRVKGSNLLPKKEHTTPTSRFQDEANRRKYVAEWAERAKQRKLAKEKTQEKQRKKLLAEEQHRKEDERILKEKQRQEKRTRSQIAVNFTRRREGPTKAERRKERSKRLSEVRKTYAESGLEGLLRFGKISIVCPFCGSAFSVETVYKHFTRAHLSQISLADKTFLENRTPARRFGTPNLEQMYELLKQTGPSEVTSKKAVEQISSNQTGTKESFQQSSYDERDASRSYAHRFRENGRFGSHPIHDDFDDESFPD